MKTLKIKLKPTLAQKEVFNNWFQTANYVYNKTIECIKKGHKSLDFDGLRDKLVTFKTKKGNDEYSDIQNKIKKFQNEKKQLDNNKNKTKIIELKLKLIDFFIYDLKNKKKRLPIEINNIINDWELETPKEIRSGAVNDVCKAHQSAFSNLKAGNIKFFDIKYRKNNQPTKSFLISKTMVKNNNGTIEISNNFFKKKNTNGKFKMGKRTIKKYNNLKINNDCRILKQNNTYYLSVPISFTIEERKQPINYCGIDAGVRTFMTTFGNNGSFEYDYDIEKLKKIDNKKNHLLKKEFVIKQRLRKRKLVKLERKKEYLVNELHWKTISHLLKTNDFLFYGDIKSHNIVKNGKNKILNTNMNNLKFFEFKQRLLFKANEKGKKVFEIKEPYTTKTCSFCGVLNNPEKSKIYECKSCMRKIGRDVNASKNMLMKGIMTCL